MSTDAAYERADWQRIEQLYGQLTRVVATGHISDRLAGKLAKAMARTCASYDGIEEQFIEDLLSIMVAVEGSSLSRNPAFRRFYLDASYNQFPAYLKTNAEDRRRPTPFEAAVETCRRLRDVNRLRAQLVRVPTGCILGGSASYGRFFNTVGDRDNEPSDLDLLLIVADYDSLPEVAEAFARVAGIGPVGVESMRERAAAFPEVRELLDEGQRCIFSHRLKLWPPDAPDPFLNGTGINGEYDVSVHVFSGEDVDFLILRDAPVLAGEREIIDYRVTRPDRPDRQRSFAETEMMIIREGTERECPHGFLVPSRVCHVGDAAPETGTRYYPGQFQNLILPEVELRWELESHLMYLPLYAFMVKVRERLERERVERPYEIQSIANSHTRKNQFAPYVGARLDDPS